MSRRINIKWLRDDTLTERNPTVHCTKNTVLSISEMKSSKREKKMLPCKFVLAQDKNLSTNLCHYLALILWPAVLQNMLNDVVAILILQEAVEGWDWSTREFLNTSWNHKESVRHPLVCLILMHYSSPSVVQSSGWDKSCSSTVTGGRLSDTPMCSPTIPLRHHCGRSDKTDAAGLERCWPDNTTNSIFAPSEMGDRQVWV